jgi:hypothetical protein
LRKLLIGATDDSTICIGGSRDAAAEEYQENALPSLTGSGGAGLPLLVPGVLLPLKQKEY